MLAVDSGESNPSFERQFGIADVLTCQPADLKGCLCQLQLKRFLHHLGDCYSPNFLDSP